MFKNVIFGIGVFAALLALLIFSGRLPINTGSKDVPTGDVVIWGTLPQNQVEGLLQAINATTKTYRISYQEYSEDTFSNKLLETLASGRSPDLILAPYQIILEHRSRIYPFQISEQQYRDLYVDGASIFYNKTGTLALPISISPLVLFYNRTIFSNAGIISPPVTWDDLTVMLSKLTVIDASNRLLQSAINLGAYNNIPATKDIIMTLVSQLEQIPVIRDSSGIQERFSVTANTPLSSSDTVRPLTSVLRFFTQFADASKNTYTWSPLLFPAQDQFVAEKLAMYIGYSDEESLIRAKNPRLDFGVKFLPQAKGHPSSVTGMKLYGLAALARAPNLKGALAAETLLGGATYSTQLSSIAGGFSPLRYILEKSPTLNDEYKKSILVAHGWLDINQTVSSQLMQNMINDVLAGRRNISEAGEAFVTALTENFNK